MFSAKAKLVYFVGGIGGCLALVFLYLTFINQIVVATSMILLVLLALIYIVILAVCAVQIDNKTVIQAQRHFMVDCRPDKAAEAFETILKKSMRAQVRLHMEVSYSTALAFWGDWEKCRALLEKMMPATNTLRQMRVEFVRHNNLFVCYYGMQNAQKAQEHLAQMQQILDKLNAGKLAWKNAGATYYPVMIQKIYLLQMLQGNDEGAAVYFNMALRFAASPIDKVGLHYHIACLYARQNRVQEAMQEFGFVAENGGTTWYAAYARQQLQQAATQP